MSGSTRVRMVAFALIVLASVTALLAFAAETGTTTTKAAATTGAAAATGSAATAGASKGNAAAAKAIFTSKCIVCHKADGSGGVKLTGNATPNWKDPKIWGDPKRKTDDYFRDCITNGKVASGMVAWGKTGQIKPADIENLIAYIHTLAPGKAPAKTATTAPAKTSATK